MTCRIPVSFNILFFTLELKNDILEYKEGCCETHKECTLSYWKVEMWRSQSPSWRMLGKTPWSLPITHEQSSLSLPLTGHCKLLVIGIPLFGMCVRVCVCACWVIARWSWIPESHSEFWGVKSPLQSQLAWLIYPRDFSLFLSLPLTRHLPYLLFACFSYHMAYI